VVGCLLASFALNSSVSATDLGTADAMHPLSGSETSSTSTITQTGSLSPIFTPEIQHWAASIETWASAANVDPNLAATVMQIESCGDPLARSRSGAMGLFQVMPFHFYSSDNPYNPDTNAARGLDYLRRSLETSFGDARLAFAGYNGGIGVISRGEFSWAAETVRYVYWGSGIYTDAVSGAGSSPRLEEWLNAGGASLCRQAHERLGLP
jgi:soluble lytic murein transglycosylase-like protein